MVALNTQFVNILKNLHRLNYLYIIEPSPRKGSCEARPPRALFISYSSNLDFNGLIKARYLFFSVLSLFKRAEYFD